jgi:uncharacterized membrane protein
MSDRTLAILAVVAAVGSGVAGGVFFAFSTFVMRALERLPAPAGLAAMQSVNVTAVGPGLMIELFGTAAICAVAGVVACLRWGRPSSAYLLAGALVYLVFVIGVTAVYHVPHNDALARLDPTAPAAAGQWRDYATGWTAWNHLRTLGGATAAALFTLAARSA